MKQKTTILISFLFLLFCSATYFIPSFRINSSENRTLATFRMVLFPEKDSVVYHDNPAERLEAALSDQFPFREYTTKLYLRLFNASDNLTYKAKKCLTKQKSNDPYDLQAIGNYVMIGDTGYITQCPSIEPMNDNIVKQRISQLDFLHKKYPALLFYAYYVTQAFDTQWFNDYIETQAADHFQEILDAVPDYVNADKLFLTDVDDYMDTHYKTDHHWNHRGARRGYEDIYSMMRRDFEIGEMCKPLSEAVVSKVYDFSYIGSYGKSLGDLYTHSPDEFSFYDYDFEPSAMYVLNPDTLVETEVSEIGLYDEYQNGVIDKDIDTDHYIAMYGSARDEANSIYHDNKNLFILENDHGNGKTLLICADSYGRAVRDTIASHFSRTVYLDYRLLPILPIDSVIDRYGVDVLLLISNTNMWNYEEYMFAFNRGTKE